MLHRAETETTPSLQIFINAAVTYALSTLEEDADSIKETPQNRGRNKSFLNSEKAYSSISKRKTLDKKPSVPAA